MAKDQPNPLDFSVLEGVHALCERLQSLLPKSFGVMTWVYNRVGADLDLTVFAAHEQSAAETLRLLRATASKLMRSEAREGNISDERWFEAPGSSDTPANDLIISSAALTTIGNHEHLRVWSRGALAGELILEKGDGRLVATLALMLEERT